MKKVTLSILLSIAIFVLSGCGSSAKEVVKDAAYYKEAFRKATTIKALNTDERVLFTMKSLRDSFLQSFDVNGTNEGINRDIIALFKSNLEDRVDSADNVEFGDNTAILISSRLAKNVSEGKLATQLKAAIKTVCDECKDEEVNTWFVDNQTSLEKSVEDHNDVDVDDDKQAYYPDVPPPIIFDVIIAERTSINIHIGSNDDTHDFVEMQAERAEAYRTIDSLFN